MVASLIGGYVGGPEKDITPPIHGYHFPSGEAFLGEGPV
jgi:hypothetical protein